MESAAECQISTVEALDSIVTVTQERDQARLCASIAATLRHILNARESGIYGIVRSPDGDHLVEIDPLAPPARSAAHGGRVRLQLVPADAARLLARGRVQIGRGDEQWILEPIYGPRNQSMVLGVCLSDPVPEALAVTRAFAQLFENFRSVLEESERDRLTDLFNRRSFDEHLGRVVARAGAADAERDQRACWLALVDIDHFKSINDGYGHLYGDEVLLLVARLMTEILRHEDLCYRYGGEEFAILLARTDEAGAHAVLERLRQGIAAHAFPQIGTVTVSIGATRIVGGCLPSDLVDRADRSLYYSKSAGRNCLNFFEDLRSRGALKGDSVAGAVELF